MTDATPPTGPALDARFVRRVLFVFGTAILLVLLWKLASIFLLFFGSVLIAVLLRAITNALKRRARMPDRLALTLAVGIVLAVLGLAGWLFAREVGEQFQRLPATLPEAWTLLRERLLTLPFGDQLVARLDAIIAAGEIPGLSSGLGGAASAVKDAADAARSFFGRTLEGLGQFVLVLVGGVYLAMAPRRYRDGFLALVPRDQRRRTGFALDVTGLALERWLVGTLIAMTIVGVFVWLGLTAVGLPSAAALGVLAGLGEFVPLVGPILTAVPGLLLAVGEGPEAVLWTLAVYVGVQQIESNVVVPLIQKKMVDLPPLLTVFAIAVFALLFGPLGVLFAVPMAVVAFVLTKTLYVRDVLGEPTDLPGRK